jgi:penicillin-binding protein 1A
MIRPATRPAHRGLNQRGLILLTTVLTVLAATLVLAFLVIGAAVLWYSWGLPSTDKATDYKPRQHMQVFTADAVEIAQFGTERRLYVPVEKIPKRLRDAVLAVEDAEFYEHNGISWRGVVRAAIANMSGGVPQGASTLTQQVARTFFLSTRRTPERKIKEALLAMKLERQLSKDQILDLYLNQIFLGQRAYGVGAAALVYFGKSLDELTVAEMAMVAGMPQNPIHANPVASPPRARKRQLWVLGRMLTTGVISEAEFKQAEAEPLQLRTFALQDLAAQHVSEMARRAVVERLGEKAYTEGVRVFTTVLADDQRAAHTALRRAVIAHERKQEWRGPEAQETLPDDAAEAEAAASLVLKEGRDDEDLRLAIVLAASPTEVTAKLASGEIVKVQGATMRWLRNYLLPEASPRLGIRRGSVVRLLQQQLKGRAQEWVITQWPQAEAAFVAMDPTTGRIRALVGGFDFNRNQFNRATSAARQPGSAFKPFLYSAVLEHGLMPETLVDDLPLVNPDGSLPSWNPQNSDNKFSGEITLRQGLVRSKNLVSVRLLQHLGLRHARNWMERFGFTTEQLPNDLTLALGTGSVTPAQLTSGYAVFANGGYRVTPVLIERIVDAQGKVLFQAPPPAPLAEETRAIPARNAFIVNTLLRDVTLRGTAELAQRTLKRRDLYGKTGTTNDAVDAWFAGFAPGVVAVAWMGYDEPRSLGERETGGGLALPIWIEAVGSMIENAPVQTLDAPPGVASVGNDWRYGEYANGGFRTRIGPPKAEPLATVAPDSDPAAAAPPAPSPLPAPAVPPAPGAPRADPRAAGP